MSEKNGKGGLPDKPSKKIRSKKEAAKELELNCAAISLSFKWLGNSRTLTKDQKQETADLFDADAKSIAASKKLFNHKHDLFKNINALKTEARLYWERMSLPYVQDGVRLFKKESVEDVVATFEKYLTEIKNCEHALNEAYDELKEE